MEKKFLIIIGFGPVAGYKYSRCIRKAVEDNSISGYAVVDLESQRATVMSRINKLPVKPVEILFLDDSHFQSDPLAGILQFHEFCQMIRNSFSSNLKVVIATEPKAHEPYLRYCIQNRIDALVTKPITLPTKNGILNSNEIYNSIKNLNSQIAKEDEEHYAVICLTRHHEIYNDGVIKKIINKMKALEAPVTSVRLHTNSGVWNLNHEFSERNDHPYKFGYGMLFHGGYHYVDLVAQSLLLNKLIYPNEEFYLELSSYSAFPSSQDYRIPDKVVKRLTGYNERHQENLAKPIYGETDIVTSFALKSRTSGKVLTLGTISLEQTTPGMRSWFNFPEVPYNINGRLHCTDFTLQVSTLYSAQGRVVKVPIGARKDATDLRGKNIGSIFYRSNASVVGDQEFYEEKNVIRSYGNSFSYSAEAEIFTKWLNGEPTGSSLSSHISSVALLDALTKSAKEDGKKIQLNFNYELPHYISQLDTNETTYNDSKDIIFSAYQ